MTEIIPAMMPKDLEDFIETAKRLVGVVPVVQVDIMDGIFVSEKTWPFSPLGSEQFTQMADQGSGMPFHGELAFELPEFLSPSGTPWYPAKVHVSLAF